MQKLTFRGKVESGDGLASRLGCPTANIAIEQGGIIPSFGVYVGETEYEGYVYPSLICINGGTTGNILKLEVHLLDFEKSLQSQILKVSITERLRDLVDWEGEEHMTKLIASDLVQAKKWFYDRGIQSPKKKDK